MVDVAQAAGVSITSVSHVLNRTRPVSDELRRRVEAAVDATGYSPNFIARSLATRSTRVVGVVMSFLTNPFFGPLVSSVERAAQQHGYTLLLSDNHENAVKELAQVRLMLDYQVDGLIIAPVFDAASQTMQLLGARRTPVVVIDRFLDCGFDDVGVENVAPTAQLVAHLASLGHTRIGFVYGRHGLSTTEERLAGYRQGLEGAGLRFDRTLVRAGDSQIGPARNAVHAMMSAARPPTAIVPANNAMTVGTLRGLRDAGAQVPSDVAIAAFDDIALGDLVGPPLTAMAQPVEQMGELAAKLLFKRIGGFTGPPERRTLPATFRHRRSCGCSAEIEDQ